jgi:hypothetical protein
MIDHSRVSGATGVSATHDAFRTWQGLTSMLPPSNDGRSQLVPRRGSPAALEQT